MTRETEAITVLSTNSNGGNGGNGGSGGGCVFMTFGEWLRTRRYERKMPNARRWSQEHLANLAGTTKATISRLESGKKDGKLETIEAIADALGEDRNEAVSLWAKIEPPAGDTVTIPAGGTKKESRHGVILIYPSDWRDESDEFTEYFDLMADVRRKGATVQEAPGPSVEDAEDTETTGNSR